MVIQPIMDRVLIKPIESESVSKGGILLPDTAKERPKEGQVIAVGKGKLLEDGSIRPLEVKVGDRVLFAQYAGTEFKDEDNEYIIVREEEILAIIK